MTYVFPRPQGFRLPGFLSRSTDAVRAEAPPFVSAESWTTAAAPAMPYVAVPGVVPLADPAAFRDHLMYVVEVEMGKLTDARAVDEWHREVLDPRISAEVAQQIRRIEQSAHERHTALQGELVATQTGAEQLAAMNGRRSRSCCRLAPSSPQSGPGSASAATTMVVRDPPAGTSRVSSPPCVLAWLSTVPGSRVP